MKFNDHWRLQGKHAFLGASKWHWINYDVDKLIQTYENWQAVERGTQLHDLAARMIKFKVRPQRAEETLSLYVNDAIDMHMTPEVVLYYSDNVFGTTDAINYDPKNKFLRIHDLKTGKSPAHMEQLMIYAALFCLEYNVDPATIGIELRLYQSNEIKVCNLDTDPDLQGKIQSIMDKIVEFDSAIDQHNFFVEGEA